MRETSSIKQYNSQSPKTILGGNTNTMKKTLSLLLAVALVLSLFASVGSVASAASAGQQLKDLGVIKGDTSGSLNETSTWDKQDLAVLISRLVGEEEIAAATPAEYGFNDIEDDYYDGYITWALQKGYITGISEREFGFNEPVSYKVLNAVILRVLGYDTTGANYDTTEDLAVSLGLSEATDFDAPAVRGIAYGSILAALNTAVKGGTVTLGQKLGVVYDKAAKLEISVPSGVVANGVSTGTVTVKVLDKNGYLVKDYNGTVTFASSSANAVLAATSVTAVKGIASVVLTSSTTAGSSLISATAAGVTGANATVTTVAQTLKKVVLSSDPAAIAADAGTSFATISAAYLDQNGVAMIAQQNGIVTGYVSSNTAALTVSGSKVYSTAAIGSSSISATLSQAAIDAGVTATPVTVSTALVGSPYKLAIDTISSKLTNGTNDETTQTITVRVLDVNGNQVTGLNAGTVALTETTSAVVTGAGAISGGKATFTAVNTTAESVTYTAASGSLVSATATGTFTAGAVANATISATPATLSANGAATSVITLQITDASANAVAAGTYNVKFSKLSGTATAAFTEKTVASANGKASITVTATTSVGSDVYQAVLYAADGTTVLATKQVTVTTQIQGAANKLSTPVAAGAVAGADQTVTVDVKDNANNTVTSDNGRAVTLTVYNADSVAVKTLTANSVNGQASFTVNLTGAGNYTVKATSAGLTDSAASAAFAVSADATTGYSISADVATIAADGASKSRLTVAGVDKYGNATAATAGYTVTASSTTYGSIGTWASDVADFTASNQVGATTITISKDGLTSASTTVNTIVVGVASKLAAVSGGSVVANGTSTQTITVSVLDANGNVRTADNTTVVTLTSSSQNTIINGVGQVTKGKVTFTVASPVAETVTLTAATAGLTSATASQAFTVGAVSQVTAASDIATIANNGSSVGNITFTLKDATGNVVTTATGAVTFELTAGSDVVTLLNTSATPTNGTVLAVVQSKLHAALNASNTVTVKAYYTLADGTVVNVTQNITATH
jgi:adhesin/invasin